MFNSFNFNLFAFSKIHPVQIINSSVLLLVPNFIIAFFILFFIFFVNSISLSFLNIKGFFLFSFYLLPFCSFFWLYKINMETNIIYFYNKFIKHNLIQSFFIFLLTEIIIFFTFFGILLENIFSTSIFLGKIWYSIGIIPVNFYHIPLSNVFFLIFSGFFINIYFRLVKLLQLIFSNFIIFKILFKLNTKISYNNIFFLSFLYHIWVLVYRNIFLTLFLGIIFLFFQSFEYLNCIFFSFYINLKEFFLKKLLFKIKIFYNYYCILFIFLNSSFSYII